jgi:hypothetical protein
LEESSTLKKTETVDEIWVFQYDPEVFNDKVQSFQDQTSTCIKIGDKTHVVNAPGK